MTTGISRQGSQSCNQISHAESAEKRTTLNFIGLFFTGHHAVLEFTRSEGY